MGTPLAAYQNKMSNPTSFVGDEYLKILDDDGGQLQQQNNDTVQQVNVIDTTKSELKGQEDLVKEAGQGGAVLGFILGGPIGSALLGFGSAYAVRKQDSMGEAARSLGELTLSVKEKASNVETEHQYWERSKRAINNICDDKTRSLAVSGQNAACKFIQDNQLIERGVEETGKGIEFVADAVSKFLDSNSTNEDREAVAVGELVNNRKEPTDEYTKLKTVGTE